MRQGWQRTFAVGVIVGIMAAAAGPAAAQVSIGSLIKLFGIGYVVKQFGPQINQAINTLMLNNQAQNKELTKVVPILTTGSGTYVGAAQVSGPAADVDRVQAVGSLAFEWNNGVWKGSVLIPIDSLNPLKGFKRVYGVGVDAVINARL